MHPIVYKEIKGYDSLLEDYKWYCENEFKEDRVVAENQGKTNFDFRTSTFIDMCQGPHVIMTNSIPEDSFKIDKLAATE